MSRKNKKPETAESIFSVSVRLLRHRNKKARNKKCVKESERIKARARQKTHFLALARGTIRI